jgi:hypothetical protein
MTRSPTLTSSGDAVALVVDPTRADGEDLALLGLLLGGVRDDQPGGGGGLGLEGLDQDAVLERLDGNRHVGVLSGSRCLTWLMVARLTSPSRGSTSAVRSALSRGEC